MNFVNFYYFVKPWIPRYVQIQIRRFVARRKYRQCYPNWPINSRAAKKPNNWEGWPNKKKFALILTHDVDTIRGHDRCYRLSKMEEELGFRSSFNFVPERYKVSADLRKQLSQRGFEIGVHGLLHDGKLYASRKIFCDRASRINSYLKEWNSVGFRSPAMHHNLKWIHDLNIEYDASTFDTDPFEPQPIGMETIFPFWVKSISNHKGYVELPYTLPQDFTLFILLRKENIDIWKRKLDWIAEKGGMALLNTHPDYMMFDGNTAKVDEYPATYYKEFLLYINHRYKDRIWHVLPKDIARFFVPIE
jgi:peptidoglycan/xylan/chitin deacetylase (PgdA/CDA1 family)